MRRIVFVASLLTGLPLSTAVAAPQVLGLFATGPTPTALHCEDGVCSAQFSAFCLQQSRDAPLDGVRYRALNGNDLRFVVTDHAGGQRTVPARDMTIRSARNYTSVVISVPQDTLRALGAERIAVAVGPRASLAPEMVANDPHPQTRQEIDRAAGPHRAVGEAIVERGGRLSEAVRAAMSVINGLQRDAVAADPSDGAAALRVLAQTATSPGARDVIADRIAICENLTQSAWYKADLAVCLQGYHDSFVSTLNGDYWNAVGTGS